MNDERLVLAMEGSFLSPLLEAKTITDISYNGKDIFIDDSLLGRKRAEIKTSKEEVGDFLRQIANYAEKQFSYSSPILDVSLGRYRLNACYQNLVRVGDSKSYSFCLRLLGERTDFGDDDEFLPPKAREILLSAVKEGSSVVIGGVTSSGKTELQKYLLRHLPGERRVIVIDNAGELERIRGAEGVDLTSWSVDERFPESSFSSLIKNALRNDPDWIVIAESRGKEALDALTSAMSGASIMMTIHAKSLEAMPNRLARLCLLGDERLLREEVLTDIRDHFQYFCFLEKESKPDGAVSRKVTGIGKLHSGSSEMEILYRRDEK